MHALERVKGKAPPPPASSELHPVSLIRSEGGKMLFTTPRRPLPLKLKLLEHMVLHWDWQLAAQRYMHASRSHQLTLHPRQAVTFGMRVRLSRCLQAVRMLVFATCRGSGWLHCTLSGLQHRAPPRAMVDQQAGSHPPAVCRVFHLLWAVHLGLLLLVPKLLQEWGLADRLRSAMKLQPAGLQRLTALLMAPLLNLCSMTRTPAVWLPQVETPISNEPATVGYPG